MAIGTEVMKDYRDDHSPDIALLLTVAELLKKHILYGPNAPDRKVLEDAMKPFEHYPDPTEKQEPDHG